VAGGLSAVVNVTTDPEILASYRHDHAAPGLLEAGEPAILVRPQTTAEVQTAIAAARDHGMPVVPRGAGSGLSGGANAVDGCMVLSLENMREILEVDVASMVATVQAGVLNVELKEAAAAAGLFYAPDPASFEFSTIGGNVATNAGGLCCVKYGVTRDSVLGLKVVLADGRLLELGGKSRKDVAGYDLVSLLCGSEGTLAVIVEVTVRLRPAPESAATMAAMFPTLGAAGEAVASIIGEMTPALLEIMDSTTIAAVEAMEPMELDSSTAALVFARSDAGQDAVREIAAMARLAEAAGATLVATTDEEAEGRMLLAARRLAYPALERLGATLLDDVAVPVGRIAELLGRVPGIAARYDLMIGTFGHAGDGNMHPTIVYRHGDKAEELRARSAFEEIVELALSLGGTVTGEHGVGTLKRDLLPGQIGEALDLHRAVKQVFDPSGLLNPGKVLSASS
jgi:glycolate oxidase